MHARWLRTTVSGIRSRFVDMTPTLQKLRLCSKSEAIVPVKVSRNAPKGFHANAAARGGGSVPPASTASTRAKKKAPIRRHWAPKSGGPPCNAHPNYRRATRTILRHSGQGTFRGRLPQRAEVGQACMTALNRITSTARGDDWSTRVARKAPGDAGSTCPACEERAQHNANAWANRRRMPRSQKQSASGRVRKVLRVWQPDPMGTARTFPCGRVHQELRRFSSLTARCSSRDGGARQALQIKHIVQRRTR